MVVTRRKGDNRLGRVSRSTNTNQAAQIKEKGSSDLSQSHALEAEAENPEQSNPSDSGNSGTDTCSSNPTPTADPRDGERLRDGGV